MKMFFYYEKLYFLSNLAGENAEKRETAFNTTQRASENAIQPCLALKIVHGEIFAPFFHFIDSLIRFFVSPHLLPRFISFSANIQMGAFSSHSLVFNSSQWFWATGEAFFSSLARNNNDIFNLLASSHRCGRKTKSRKKFFLLVFWCGTFLGIEISLSFNGSRKIEDGTTHQEDPLEL